MSGSVAVASYQSFLEPRGIFCGDASLASLQSPTSGDLQRPPSSSHRHGAKASGGSGGSRGETGDFSSPRRCSSQFERPSGSVRFVEPTAGQECRGDGPVVYLPRTDARGEGPLPADAHAARGAERHGRKKMRKCQATSAAAETLPREEGEAGAAAPVSSEDEDVVMSVHAEPEGGAGGSVPADAAAADSFVGGAWLWQASLNQGTAPAVATAAVAAPAPAVGASASSIDSPSSGAAPAPPAAVVPTCGPRSILRSAAAAAARRARAGRVVFAPSVKGHCGLRPLSRALDQLVWRFFGSRLGAPVSFPVPEVPPLPGASLPVLWAEVAAGPAARAVIAALTSYQPPADVLPAAAAILTDPALAGGCPRALRGLLRAVEGLHVRLLEAILRDRLPAGTLDDENDGDAAAQPPLAAAPTPFDDSDDGSDEELLEGAAAEAARRAEAAAAAYAAKRREPTAPVLPGGGGTCAKLSAAHVSWVQQLVMLLRHAVLLAPSPVGDTDEDYDEL